jgi:hypothetical protein
MQLYIHFLFIKSYFYVYNANYRIFLFSRHRGINGINMDFLYV